MAKSLETLNLLDQVEAEVEPPKLGQALEALDSRDNVVVELELDKSLDADKVVDFDDVYPKSKNNRYI